MPVNCLTLTLKVRFIKVAVILLVQMPAICSSKTKPSTRINLDAADEINRAVLKSIRSSSPTYCVDRTSKIG